MEIAIFRVVQECLTNIHRHSGSATATISIVAEDCRILVRVQDRGKGIPLKRQLELNSTDRTGVGFRGMRERVRQLGGSLEIQSDGNGTVIVASLPLRHPRRCCTHDGRPYFPRPGFVRFLNFVGHAPAQTHGNTPSAYRSLSPRMVQGAMLPIVGPTIEPSDRMTVCGLSADYKLHNHQLERPSKS
jgi:hypothetical protein